MLRHITVVAAVILLLSLGAVRVGAAEFAVMSAGALEAGITELARQFERDSGHTLRIEIGNAPQLAARLAAGESADVLVAPANVIAQAVADRRVVAASRVTVGRVGVGVLVPAGVAKPGIASVDALRSSLLAATAIVYNQGSSGTYIEGMLMRLGIAEAVASKTVRVLNGEAVMERLSRTRANEMAFVAMSDAIRATGMQYVGPLPSTLQNFTSYDAVVMNRAGQPQAAAAFLAYLTSPAARVTWNRAGVD